MSINIVRCTADTAGHHAAQHRHTAAQCIHHGAKLQYISPRWPVGMRPCFRAARRHGVSGAAADGDVLTNDPSIYLANGYKPIILTDCQSDGKSYVGSWMETETKITQVLTVQPQI